jgi:hypothetical protein
MAWSTTATRTANDPTLATLWHLESATPRRVRLAAFQWMAGTGARLA